jgi:NAD(P)-dependent dehydrogenase (short-subunit alcohol dehydrogenase family)
MSLVRTGAVELGPKGIRVNSVSPGVVWTPRVGALLGDAGKASQSRNAPLGDVARPADIAAGLLFFASDLSRFITGQTLSIDGGVSAKFPFDMDNV